MTEDEHDPLTCELCHAEGMGAEIEHWQARAKAAEAKLEANQAAGQAVRALRAAARPPIADEAVERAHRVVFGAVWQRDPNAREIEDYWRDVTRRALRAARGEVA